MSNFTRIATCVATGVNAFIKGDKDPIASQHLGPDSTWAQRQAFRCGYLQTWFKQMDDTVNVKHCKNWIDRYIAAEDAGMDPIEWESTPAGKSFVAQLLGVTSTHPEV